MDILSPPLAWLLPNSSRTKLESRSRFSKDSATMNVLQLLTQVEDKCYPAGGESAGVFK